MKNFASILFVLGLSNPALAAVTASVDGGIAYVMGQEVSGGTRVVNDFTLNVGMQMKDALRFELGVMMQREGSGSASRPSGVSGLRPGAKFFVFGGSLYGRASLPIARGNDGGLGGVGLMVGGGYELKLLGILGGFAEGGIGYNAAFGGGSGDVPIEGRAGVVFKW